MSEITTIRFDGDNLQTVHEGERVWVVVKRVCEALGLQPHGQAEKLSEKPWAVTQLVCAAGPDGKNYEMFCADLETLPMWLATIDVGRVKPEAREKLIAYQKECARVLRDHFFGRSSLPALDIQALAAAIAQAVVHALAPHLSALTTAVTGIAESQANMARQVAWLVTNTGPGGAISYAQHRQLQAEVRSIAALEAASGRHKNTRASSADIYREMGRIVSWGGKGQPWNNLPAHLAQPALSVLAGRRKDVEKRLCARGVRQLNLAPAQPSNDNAKGV